MNISNLQSLGWSNFFLQQLSPDEIATNDSGILLFRVIAIHRNRIVIISNIGRKSLIVGEEYQPVSQHIAVGDWLLAEPAYEHYKIIRLLNAKNRIERWSNDANQMIAANLDYLFIVTSANDEFNVKRLQRYLALAYEFDIEPVVILTKIDIATDVETYIEQIEELKVNYFHAMSNRDIESYHQLEVYFKSGTTIALVGSSGVGKTTLINMISDHDQAVNEIRHDDAKGKHTTTHRELFFCKNNVAIIDTPGMRELQLIDNKRGVEDTFSDILQIALTCKFNDCSHESEPNCAIKLALEQKVISEVHLNNFKKLLQEDAFLKRKSLGPQAEKQFYKSYRKKINSNRKNRH